MGPARFEPLHQANPSAIAHRGGAKEKPENSWSAFEHAIELGYRYIETDVHATSDGIAVCIHDPNLDRVTTSSGLVRSKSWEELSKVRLQDARAIPRLDDVLTRWPECYWNVDVKHHSALRPTLSAIDRTGAHDRVLLTAFSDLRVAHLRHRTRAGIALGAGPIALTMLRLGSLLPDRRTDNGQTKTLMNRIVGDVAGWHSAAQVPIRWGRISVLDRKFIETAHRGKLAVHVWTIDDETTMNELIDLGVDGIMTDRPSTLKAVLEDRGLWPEGIS